MMTLLLALLACTGAPPEPQMPADPKDGDTLVVAAMFDPGNANPLVAPYAFSAMLIDQVQPGLVQRDLTDEGLIYEPALAESFAWSDGGTTLTYTLRDDVVWGDGTPLTSDDVRFSQELIANPEVASNWLGDAQNIASIDTPDDRTVVFHFTGPKNPILQQGFTIRGIVPRHHLKDADPATLRGHESAKNPLPSGPFRIAKWEPDATVVLEPNERAPEAWKPHLERVIVRVLPEYSTRLIELKTGGVDLAMDIEFGDVAELVADPRLSVLREPAGSMMYIGWNNADARFSDPAVRRALTLGVDRDKLIADLLTAGGETYGRPCTSTVAPTLGAWAADDIAPLPHDIAAAKALLAEGGWTDTDGDGIADRDGRPLKFTVIVQNGNSLARRTAVTSQAMLREIGAEMDIEMLDPNRFSQRAREHDFEAILWSFGNNPKVDPSIQWRTDGRYNWYGYSNPEVDALIEAGIASPDIEASQDAFRKAQRLIHADQPVTFLFWKDSVMAIDNRFQDVQTTQFSNLFHLERWWVPVEQRKYAR